LNSAIFATAPPADHAQRQNGAVGWEAASARGDAGLYEQYSDFSMVGGMGLISVPSSCSMRYLPQQTQQPEYVAEPWTI